jgi:transcriptional regulator GlxA family with amidase domain
MASRRVVVLAMPNNEVVEVGGLLDIFYAVNERTSHVGTSVAAYAVEVVSPVETVCAWPGLRLVADRSFRSVRGPIDTLIVTGVELPDDARRDPELVRWLARMAPRTRRVVGLCTGAFLLAEAGLLDGRTATTHWAFCDELAKRFAAINVQPDPIYVCDGGVYTSAGDHPRHQDEDNGEPGRNRSRGHSCP